MLGIRTGNDWQQILREEHAEQRRMRNERCRELEESLENCRAIYGRLEDAGFKDEEVFTRLDNIEESLLEVLNKYNG
jgi:hypothetical protein